MKLFGAYERRGGGRRGARSGGAVVHEVPTTIPSLKAWFDARSDAYFTFSTGAQISAWVSRAGSLGAVALAQATSGNQPLRDAATSTFGNKSTVLFDGTDDFLQSTTAADWAFMHDGTGSTVFVVRRCDSTGFADQALLTTHRGSASFVGAYQQMRAASLAMSLSNGSATWLNDWNNNTAGHFTRDASAWQAWSYSTGTQRSSVSGSSVTNADTGGQSPSVAAPEYALKIGRGSAAGSSYKGKLACALFYGRNLAAAERATLGAWAAREYGVAA